MVLRVQEGLNTRLVKPLGSTPFDLFFARSPEMRREGRGEVEVSESELENVVRIGDRNEVMVKVVYPEVAEKVKKVRVMDQGSCPTFLSLFRPSSPPSPIIPKSHKSQIP